MSSDNAGESLTSASSKYIASLPVPNPTRSFWATSPNPTVLSTEGSTGSLTTDADICIIGSGITGVSAAYHLARLLSERKVDDVADGIVKIAILEARDFCKHVS